MLLQIGGWLADRRHRHWIALGLLATALIMIGFRFAQETLGSDGLDDPRNQRFLSWWQASEEERREMITVQRDLCPGAPFILPADGYIGLLYGDPRGPYSETHLHQGIDIFSINGPGETPVYAAYDGYLTREEHWRSAVILRVPDDPLHPGRQIWLYYTHMADASGEQDFVDDAFPPGISEVFVAQGTLLGYTGNYSGNPLNPVGVHLHFSLVQDDGRGNYTNELDFNNTIDPSRYLGMAVNYGCAPPKSVCTLEPTCAEAALGAGGD